MSPLVPRLFLDTPPTWRFRDLVRLL